MEARKDLDSKFAQAVKQDAPNVEIEAAQGLALLEKGQHAMAVVRPSAAITASGVPLPREDELATAHLTSMSVRRMLLSGWHAESAIWSSGSASRRARPAKAVALDGPTRTRGCSMPSRCFSSKYATQAQIKELLRLSPGHTYVKRSSDACSNALRTRRVATRIHGPQGRGYLNCQEIQAIAERSIRRVVTVWMICTTGSEKGSRRPFPQIAQAEMTQEADRAEQAQRMAASSAILDVDLGGVDVDKLLQELQDMEPDPAFPRLQERWRLLILRSRDPADTRVENQDSPSLPPSPSTRVLG